MTSDLGKLDREVLELASTGLSPEAIAGKFNGAIGNPAKVAVHIKRLISSPDEYLSIPEQIRLNLQMMRLTLGELSTQYLDNDSAKVRLSYFQAISKELDRLQKTNDQDLETYSVNVGRAMAQAYDIAMAHFVGRLADRIPLEELQQLKREALEVAQGEVAKKQLAE